MTTITYTALAFTGFIFTLGLLCLAAYLALAIAIHWNDEKELDD